MDTPLTHTDRGNLPTSELVLRPSWEIHSAQLPRKWWQLPRGKTLAGVTMVMEYFHEGELVRRDVHVYKTQGIAAAAQAGKLD